MLPPTARRVRSAAACACVALAVTAGAGCGDNDLSGSVGVSGSSTLLPLVSSVAGTFSAAHPLTRVKVDMTGTAAGLTALCDGISDIAGASREMNRREKAECAASGVTPVRLLLARDALVFFTRTGRARPACLTPADVYALAGPEAVGTRRWSDATRLARRLGSRTALPAQPLEVVAPGTSSGTRQLVEDTVIGPLAERRAREAAIRPDSTTVPSDQVMLGEVLKAPAALAFAGFATVNPWQGSVRTIAVDTGSGCVVPTAESIRSGAYALSRSLYAYVNLEAARRDPTVAEFVTALVQGAARADDASGVIALDAARGAATSAAWRAARTDGDVTGS